VDSALNSHPDLRYISILKSRSERHIKTNTRGRGKLMRDARTAAVKTEESAWGQQ